MTTTTTIPLLPIFDGHNDALTHIPRHGRSMFTEGPTGHIDLPRARRGGLRGGIFAIFAPGDDMPPPAAAITTSGYDLPLAAPLDPDRALRFTEGILAHLDAMRAEPGGDALRLILDTRDLDAAWDDSDALAIVLHLEGAEAIKADLSNLEAFYDRGLRSLGLTWSRPNAFGHGVPFCFPRDPDTGPGLTPAGRDLIRACNALGVLIDLAHLNAAGFWDVARLSTAPLVVSHSNAFALCPSTRNLTDAQIDAVAASGGVIGLNFCVAFLRADGGDDPDTSLDTIVRHADHIANRVGPDHVALGSDFDGARMPAPLRDAAGLPRLLDAFRQLGWDEPSLHKLASANWRRVLEQTWGPPPA